jgi:RimJ/RimL family protein N-acetyltransferase
MLDTRRLRLRRLCPADEALFVALDSDPEVMRYIGSRGGTPEEIVARVRDRIAADHGALGWWVIEGRDDGAFHGVAALLRMPDGDDIELAYRLARASWGAGLATEAASALARYAFDQVGLPRLVAVTFPENIASQHVLEKVGFVHDGMSNYQTFQVTHFTFEASEWRTRRAEAGDPGRRGRGLGRRARR